eukprot:TRINITY_DN44374_c0_g1_i1.p1 TRINITY_DN44374_c0_g1~~TRINITY_DN44374_c0_g1_i1.p1  ORF type:complete len:397 (+),score=53.65 TRINITY_DN44374_c0_g1_i1:53-1243(+)
MKFPVLRGLQLSGARATHRAQCPSRPLRQGADVEAPPIRNRQFRRDSQHAMRNAREEEKSVDDDSDEECENVGLEARLHQLSPAEREAQKHRQRRALKSIKGASDAKSVLKIIRSTVEVDWVGTCRELHGNIYRAWAFGEMQKHERLRGDTMKCIFQTSQFFGCCVICCIQIFGPIALIRTYLRGYGLEKPFNWETDWQFSLNDWNSVNVWKKVMSILFLAGYILNGIFVITEEVQSWRKVDWLFRQIMLADDVTKPGACRFALMIGAVTNCYVVVSSTLAMFLIFGNTANAKDVLFDALGLLFLYNLDDIGGEFAFVSGNAWPGFQMAWMTDPDHDEIGTVCEEFGHVPDGWQIDASECCTIIYLFRFTIVVLACAFLVLPVLFAFVPWDTLMKV